MSGKGVGSPLSMLVPGTPGSRRASLGRAGQAYRHQPSWLAVALGLALGGLGCSSGESARPSKAAASAGSPRTEPEQVVQRMVATPEPAAAPEAGRVSAAGVQRAGSAPSPARQPITARHLEAELNRLEAELD